MGMSYHSMFIMEDGTVKGCGQNSCGQLGIGNTAQQTSPVDIPIADVKQIACGSIHTMFLLNDGTVKGCGHNRYGSLGIGNTTDQLNIVDIPITDVKQISCGVYHTMFLLNDGTIKGCGDNYLGQLGLGDTESQLNIVDIPISNVKQVACGISHTMFLLNDGTVKGCGQNSGGSLGIGNSTKQKSIVNIPINNNVKQVRCGGYHTMFLLNDGTVKGCGHNRYGSLGIGNTTDQLNIVDIPITDVKQISCGVYHTMFLLKDGTVKGCGQNNKGQLGIGNTTNQLNIVDIPITDVKQIACGMYYTIFLLNDGTFKGCGENTYGQLGIGNTDNQTSLVDIPVISVLVLLKQLNQYYSINPEYYNTTNKTYTPLESFNSDVFNTYAFDKDDLFTEQTITIDEAINETETFKPIDKFNKIKIIYNKPTTSISASGLKSNKQLIVAKDDISVSVAINIDYFKLLSDTSGLGKVRLALSIDQGSTWLTYNSVLASFEILDCTIPTTPFKLMTEDEQIQWNNAQEVIETNGISPSIFNSLDFNILNADTIRFAYVLIRPAYSDVAETSQLDWQFDAKGSMEKMKESEYNIQLLGGQIRVTSLIDNPIIKANIIV